MTSEDEDLPTSRLKGDEPNTDPESGFSNMFKNKMGSRRSYYIVLTLLIFIFAVLILAVLGLSYAYLASDGNKSCTSADCLRSATSFVESMDRSADPCEDFYQFACGNYPKFHRIPKTAFSNDPFSEANAVMLTLIRDFLEKDDSDTEPYPVLQSRVLYESCVATDKMDAAGLTALFELLDKIGLPSLGFSSKKDELNLTSILAGVKKYVHIDYLFATSVDANPKNRTTNQISLAKPADSNMYPVHKIAEKMKKMNSRKIRETLASEETVENEDNKSQENEAVAIYLKYFKDVWMEINKHQKTSSYASDRKLWTTVVQLLTFNNKLSEIKDRVYDTDNQLPVVMTVDQFQEYTDNITQVTSEKERIIDWKQYLNLLFVEVENVTLDFETDLIQINNMEYFEALFKMLVKSRKNIDFINLWWEVVTTLLPYTTNQLRFIQDTYFYKTAGLENNPSRSLYCADAVNKMMGMAVSYLLLDVEPLERNKKMMEEMMENIHWAFEKIVKDLKWMDETTKKRTLYKAQQMKTFVGHPEFIKDPYIFEDYYNDYEVKENDFFGNVIRYVQLDLNTTLLGLGQPNDYAINSWASAPLEVNAYNWIQANAITIPAGILQFPFFGHDLQMLNYGYLGSILGHELTHGFDNTGRKFDQDGNADMWWTNQTIDEYEKRTDCFVNRYESYLLPGIEEKVNGKLTLDENIADNGGLREALWAYRKFVADHGEEPQLPGLEEFSNEQIYYLAFANNWCEATTNESLSNSLLDEHSPNYVRVVAGLTNSEEFSEVWKCSKGTRMNPDDEKCKIW